MAITPGTNKIGHAFKEGRKKYARATYSFAADGGAIGDITLTTTPLIPAGALVTEAMINVTTVPTSGGAPTIALKLDNAADVNAADAISGAPWSTTGLKRADALVGANSGVKVGASAVSLKATVATATLTAGAFDVYIEYMEGA